MPDNVQNPAAGSFRSHTPQRDEGLGLHASPSSTEPAELPEPSRRSSAAAPNAFLGAAATLSELEAELALVEAKLAVADRLSDLLVVLNIKRAEIHERITDRMGDREGKTNDR